ncbi:elongin BC and Polycomb repressive complex 2-associated protein-like [Dasypus novemcinctus]|uniref:elongin BC and Polycomb repressive complex 2-associated protein-like n=1 Tax=Dasypus novemcinctus TaxID=9361 RepID=UPI0039C9E203
MAAPARPAGGAGRRAGARRGAGGGGRGRLSEARRGLPLAPPRGSQDRVTWRGRLKGDARPRPPLPRRHPGLGSRPRRPGLPPPSPRASAPPPPRAGRPCALRAPTVAAPSGGGGGGGSCRKSPGAPARAPSGAAQPRAAVEPPAAPGESSVPPLAYRSDLDDVKAPTWATPRCATPRSGLPAAVTATRHPETVPPSADAAPLPPVCPLLSAAVGFHGLDTSYVFVLRHLRAAGHDVSRLQSRTSFLFCFFKASWGAAFFFFLFLAGAAAGPRVREAGAQPPSSTRSPRTPFLFRALVPGRVVWAHSSEKTRVGRCPGWVCRRPARPCPRFCWVNPPEPSCRGTRYLRVSLSEPPPPCFPQLLRHLRSPPAVHECPLIWNPASVTGSVGLWDFPVSL